MDCLRLIQNRIFTRMRFFSLFCRWKLAKDRAEFFLKIIMVLNLFRARTSSSGAGLTAFDKRSLKGKILKNIRSRSAGSFCKAACSLCKKGLFVLFFNHWYQKMRLHKKIFVLFCFYHSAGLLEKKRRLMFH